MPAPLRCSAAALLAACLATAAAPAWADHPRGPRAPSCAELAGRTIADARILSSALVAATATLPEYCNVRGVIGAKLNFELRLPTA